MDLIYMAAIGALICFPYLFLSFSPDLEQNGSRFCMCMQVFKCSCDMSNMDLT